MIYKYLYTLLSLITNVSDSACTRHRASPDADRHLTQLAEPCARGSASHARDRGQPQSPCHRVRGGHRSQRWPRHTVESCSQFTVTLSPTTQCRSSRDRRSPCDMFTSLEASRTAPGRMALGVRLVRISESTWLWACSTHTQHQTQHHHTHTQHTAHLLLTRNDH